MYLRKLAHVFSFKKLFVVKGFFRKQKNGPFSRPCCAPFHFLQLIHCNAQNTYLVQNASVEKWLSLKFRNKNPKTKSKESLEFCDSSSLKATIS